MVEKGDKLTVINGKTKQTYDVVEENLDFFGNGTMLLAKEGLGDYLHSMDSEPTWEETEEEKDELWVSNYLNGIPNNDRVEFYAPVEWRKEERENKEV